MLFPDMHCMRRVYRDKKASVHWSAARKKERFSYRGQTGYQPLVKRGFCSSIGIHRIFIVRSSRTHPGGHSSIVWGVRVFVVSWANSPVVGVLCCPPRPAPLSRRAPPRTDPPGVCPGFGLDRFSFLK